MYISALTVGSGKGHMRDLEFMSITSFPGGLNVSLTKWNIRTRKTKQFVMRHPCIDSAWNSASTEIAAATLPLVFTGIWRQTPFRSGTEDRLLRICFIFIFLVQQTLFSERTRSLQWASLGGIVGANCDLRITWNDQSSVESPENHWTWYTRLRKVNVQKVKNKPLSWADFCLENAAQRCQCIPYKTGHAISGSVRA